MRSYISASDLGPCPKPGAFVREGEATPIIIICEYCTKWVLEEKTSLIEEIDANGHEVRIRICPTCAKEAEGEK
jgi:hypothetical protein